MTLVDATSASRTASGAGATSTGLAIVRTDDKIETSFWATFVEVLAARASANKSVGAGAQMIWTRAIESSVDDAVELQYYPRAS